MKKILALILFIVLLTTPTLTNAASDTVRIYAPDGREICIYKTEVDAYKKVGWYENKSDVITTMYAPDGREICIYKAEVDAYKKVGWYENKSDVTATMYALDGREICIYKAEVDAYKKVGWYENKSDVTATLVAADGRKIVVYKSEVPAYTNLGWLPTQSSIDPTKPMVALTFDDGPRPQSTERIVDVLSKYNAKATFFVLGNLAEIYPETVKKAYSIGCQIGNHSYSHPQLTAYSSYNVSLQINSTDEIINNIIGNYPSIVRPPYGSYNNSVLSAANKPFILWSVDTLDWKSRNADSVTYSVLSSVRDGDVILMHDIYDSTAAAAERIVPALLARGFQLVTIDELAYYKNYTLSAERTYSQFR